MAVTPTFANLQCCRTKRGVEAANLPPRGGDGRQARGGREGTRRSLNLNKVQRARHA
ncbi:hypothetical protein MPL3356_40381 [Mesorhizobium plurifarium]|uniref:Uncharacterized protein n=1 Tax=Mesorhizobium plurifarium TaxID=69974 RepID=A0A090FX82_MESPL|nr:hypothetical protein MPL3356_40381 [Mesorhizobium plurifarium]